MCDKSVRGKFSSPVFNPSSADQPSERSSSSSVFIESKPANPFLEQAASSSSREALSGQFKAAGGKAENISISAEFVTKCNCKMNELIFYEENAQAFSSIVPGVKSIDKEQGMIVLYNIARNMKSPVFLDVKLGGTFTDSFYLRSKKGLSGDELHEKYKNATKKINKRVQIKISFG